MNPLAPQSRVLYQAALVLFLVTIVIGILNGLDVWDPSHEMLITHVHAGTLGWITMAVLGVVLAMFGTGASESELASGRNLARYGLITIVLYVITFALGSGWYRPVAGTLLLIVLIWLLIWTVGRYRNSPRSTGHLAICLATISLVIGAILGVLLGLFIANGSIPGLSVETAQSLAGAHPPAMLIGYLILAGVAVAAWQLDGANNRLGRTAAWILFLSGVIANVAFITNNEPLIQVFSALQVIGSVVFLIAIWPKLRPAAGGSPFAKVAELFLAIGIALLIYVVQLVVSGQLDPEAGTGPIGVLTAFDHAMFIGVMTNALLAVISGLIAWGGADRLLLWAINVSLAAFIVGLAVDSAILKRISTPILGLALIWAIAVAVPALGRSRTA
jgi:hypothetical protein